MSNKTLMEKKQNLHGKYEPLVSVVTPVYNGEKYIGDCIKSVLNQTYQNWEYIIVNNCSTDGTLDIVNGYCKKDNRIFVHNNLHTLDVISNHNCAFKKISNSSKYCKVLHADDWMFSSCIKEMVDIAEKNPTVGLVGSYNLAGTKVKCDGLPYPSTIMPGRMIARQALLGKIFLFYSPSTLLIKSDLIRNCDNFYTPNMLHADDDAIYRILDDCDFGFVHQVLTFIRHHEDSVSAHKAIPYNSFILSNLDLFLKYGKKYLDSYEFKKRRKQLVNRYYRFLSKEALNLRETKFWNFHRKRLLEMGMAFSISKLIWTIMNLVFHRPIESLKTISFACSRSLTN
jgi:glycosyltransferase involved in cell wall biosynthesis